VQSVLGWGVMILVFGSINMDVVTLVRTIPRPGETVLSRRADTFFGGKGANQAVAAARAARGGPHGVALVGAVGRDPFGQACMDNLKSNGVDNRPVRFVNEPTGCAFITVDESGENAITVASGANMSVRSADVEDNLLTSASVLVLQTEVPLRESLAVARRARERNAKVVWNLAPAPIDADRELLDDVLAAADVLVVNEQEAATTAALIHHGQSFGPDSAALHLSGAYDVACIVTAGARGATATYPDGTRDHAPAPSIVPVDSTGAGDTFVGVLANQLAEGETLSGAMQVACLAASLSCLVLGAQDGMPFREALTVVPADVSSAPI
jgi:ribokinase